MTSQMTSKVKNATWYQKIFCQNVPQVTLNNFAFYKYFEKIEVSCSKRRLSGKISEIEQNGIVNDVISHKRDLVIKNIFCRNVPQVTLNMFTPHKYLVKLKLSC